MNRLPPQPYADPAGSVKSLKTDEQYNYRQLIRADTRYIYKTERQHTGPIKLWEELWKDEETKAWIIANLWGKFNMEENIQEVKQTKCMSMPVEEYNKTEAKQWIERKIQGKAIFFWEEQPSRGESGKLRLFRWYCEEKGKK